MANAAIAGLKWFIYSLFPQIHMEIVSYPAIEGTYMVELYKQQTGRSFPTTSINKVYEQLKKPIT
jgi:hypothetical protein